MFCFELQYDSLLTFLMYLTTFYQVHTLRRFSVSILFISQLNREEAGSVFLRSTAARCHVSNLTAVSRLSVSVSGLWPRNLSYHIVFYHIVSYRIISYRILSYRIISYNIVSYRIISPVVIITAMAAQCSDEHRTAIRPSKRPPYENDKDWGPGWRALHNFDWTHVTCVMYFLFPLICNPFHWFSYLHCISRYSLVVQSDISRVCASHQESQLQFNATVNENRVLGAGWMQRGCVVWGWFAGLWKAGYCC